MIRIEKIIIGIIQTRYIELSKKAGKFFEEKNCKNKTPSHSKNNQIMEHKQRKGNCNVICDLLKFGQCLEIAVNWESNLCICIKFSFSEVKFSTQ
jgi:hypothetical protein